MCLDERIPCGLVLPQWRRLDAMGLENVAHGGVGDAMTQIGQGTLDAIIAPRRILPRHSQDQLGRLGRYGRPAGLGLPTHTVIPLGRHQLAMPAEDRIGRDDGGDLL